MPWVPATDFEEEVVNLHPHHDFIYGALSEPPCSYPRPKAHTEYAVNKMLEDKEEQKNYEATGKINGKLRVIQQVQRIANTKTIGEQPTIDDWENNKKIEQEIVGMMRYCGMGVSVEQPLNEKVTVATFPVENTIKVVKNGRRKVALFFDENVFKMKEKVDDTSSGFESCNNSASNVFENSKNDSLASELESDASFNTSSLLSLNSFSTAGEYSDTLSSVSSGIKSRSTYMNEKVLHYYDKLLEDTELLSLDSSKSHSRNSSRRENSDSFVTAEESSVWKPILEDDVDIFSKKENWPVLPKNDDNVCIKNNKYCNNIIDNNQSDSTADNSSEANSSKDAKRTNFLDRFIKSNDAANTLNATNNSISSISSQDSTTYAAITKAPQPKPKENKKASSKLDFPLFYTTRRMYALKRNIK